MKVRLIVSLIVGSLLLGMVAGCAPAVVPTDSPSPATQPPAGEEQAAPAPAEPTSEAQPVEKSKVVVWMAGDDARFMMDSDLPAKFEEQHPQYTVEIVQLPWDTLHDKFVAGIGGGELPSVAQGADHWVGEFADLDGLKALDDFKEQNGYADEDFFPNAWDHFRFTDGKLYAAPFYWESRLLFYRTDLLEQAGLSEPPVNLDELLEYGAQLSNGTDRFGLAHQDSWLDFHFFSWLLYAKDGDFYNADQTECALTEEPALAALEYYKTLYDQNIIPKDPEKRVETFQGFKEGYYAMAESGAWWFGLLRTQAPELEGKWNVAMLPEGETTITYGHPNPWLVPANGTNVEGGLAWIEFMLQPENAVTWATFYGQTPTMLAAFEDPALQDDFEQQMMYEAGLRGVNSIHNIPAAETVTEIVWNMLADVRDGVKEPAQAATDTCKRMAEYLW